MYTQRSAPSQEVFDASASSSRSVSVLGAGAIAAPPVRPAEGDSTYTQRSASMRATTLRKLQEAHPELIRKKLHAPLPTDCGARYYCITCNSSCTSSALSNFRKTKCPGKPTAPPAYVAPRQSVAATTAGNTHLLVALPDGTFRCSVCKRVTARSNKARFLASRCYGKDVDARQAGQAAGSSQSVIAASSSQSQSIRILPSRAEAEASRAAGSHSLMSGPDGFNLVCQWCKRFVPRKHRARDGRLSCPRVPSRVSPPFAS